MPDIDHERQNIEDHEGLADTVGKAGAGRGVTAQVWPAKPLLFALACAGLVACGSGSAGTNLIDTTYDGFPAAGSTIDAYTILYTGPDCSDPEQQISVIAVVMSDSAGGCAAAQAGHARASSTDLNLLIVGQSGTPGAAAPSYAQVLAAQVKNENGGLNVGPAISDGAGNFFTFTATFGQRDATCQTAWTEAISDSTVNSTIQIQAVEATEVQGVFQVAFSDANAIALAGIFDQAHACPLTSAQFCALSTETLACQ